MVTNILFEAMWQDLIRSCFQKVGASLSRKIQLYVTVVDDKLTDSFTFAFIGLKSPESVMYRARSFITSTQSIFTRSHVQQSGLLQPLVRNLPCMQVRRFVGKIIPWYKTWQLKGTENTRLASPVLLRPLSSVSPVDLAKEIAAVRNANGHFYLYNQFKESSGMTQVNRITILHHLARFAVSAPRKNFASTKKVLKEQQNDFYDLLNNIAADFDKCKPRDLASIVWAMGKLRENVVWFVSECENEILKRDESSFMAPAVCQLLNGFASLDLKRSKFFTCVEKRVLEGKLKLKDFENRGLSGALWSFTKSGNGSIEFFEKIQEEILQRDVKRFTTRQLAQFLWSFTEKKMQCDELFEMIKQEIHDRPLTDQPNDGIKMILRSLAKMETAEDDSCDLFNRLGEELLARGIHDFDTGELAMLAWSFAKKCPKMDAIFDFLEEEINLRELSDFRNHELSLLLWAFAKAECFSDDLFATCQEEILSRNLSMFKSEQLSQLAWAFAKSTVPSSEFYSRLEKEVLNNTSNFSDNELCMTARGFAQASSGTQKLFKKIEEEILDRDILEDKPDFIPEIAWVFSKCSYQASPLFDEIEKVLKGQGRFSYKGQELKIINSAFSKTGKELPFAQLKTEGRRKTKWGKD